MYEDDHCYISYSSVSSCIQQFHVSGSFQKHELSFLITCNLKSQRPAGATICVQLNLPVSSRLDILSVAGRAKKTPEGQVNKTPVEGRAKETPEDQVKTLVEGSSKGDSWGSSEEDSSRGSSKGDSREG
jgi:hypothetical protein